MKTKDIRSRLESLKSNCITSINTSFNQFIIETDLKKNQLEFIIDDELRYKYWLEQTFAINEIIQELSTVPHENKDILI